MPWSHGRCDLLATSLRSACRIGLCAIALVEVIGAQSAPQPLGGDYASLDARRQELIADWVGRFNDVTGQKSTPGPFYDSQVRVSARTTFDAVTNALIRTSLTDASGQPLGNALDLIERVQSARGRIAGAAGDQQFRLYVQLKPSAITTLTRSREFKRADDNTVFHHGYPINYRQEGGAPSIQISIALDHVRADIDVDYRSSGFPSALFNGHLSASNSDVRAGNNYDRHANRWTGFQNWWRNVFGLRSQADDDAQDERPGALPVAPRAGRKNIDAMMHDFLTAWLVDGDTLGAFSYFSERSYACMTEDRDDGSAIDRGTAPFALIVALKRAHEALGLRTSLDGVAVGVRLAMPALKLVTQPYHSRFVIYSIPDDVAASFDCESRQTPGDARKARREYGKYFGATFYIDVPGGKDHSLALLWAQQAGYWKIVSWQAEPEGDDGPRLHEPPGVKPTVTRSRADATLVDAARGFLDSWLMRKDYDAAFRYLSPAAYACYDLVRGAGQPAAASLDDAGRRIRIGLERSGTEIGKSRNLDELMESVEPIHPAVRVLDHRYSNAFTLTSLPDAIADASSCAARARGDRAIGDAPLQYGQAFGLNLRFRTQSGEAPVLRLLWSKEAGGWRITGYDVELP